MTKKSSQSTSRFTGYFIFQECGTPKMIWQNYEMRGKLKCFCLWKLIGRQNWTNTDSGWKPVTVSSTGTKDVNNNWIKRWGDIFPTHDILNMSVHKIHWRFGHLLYTKEGHCKAQKLDFRSYLVLMKTMLMTIIL